MLRATVSGSFHRHMAGVYDAVGELRVRSVDVLSPSDPRVVDFIGEFLFVASDKIRSIKLVQERHFKAIEASDFLWVVCPDGYTGPSTCMEIDRAHSHGVPVFSLNGALDITVGEYVRKVSSYDEAIEIVKRDRAPKASKSHVLIDPTHAIHQTIGQMERLQGHLEGRLGDGKADAERAMAAAKQSLRESFGDLKS